jgi:DNA processing protein
VKHLRYWLGFNLTHGIGAARLRKLIEAFGDVERAWHASPDALRQSGLDKRTLDSLLRVRHHADLDAILAQVQRAGAEFLPIDSPNYPDMLRQIPDPPFLLYLKGALPDLTNAVAVVGTRRATPDGEAITAQICADLVRAGVTVVSGMALGIDATAHRAAIGAGGKTVAVLPCGIDQVYPPEHVQLAAHIAEHGALLTEFSPGEPAQKTHFAPRNRIISGLCRAVLVVEAGIKSGALITVDRALEQGRDVYAVPGNPLSPNSKGPNALIQAGAKMVTSAEDILNEFNLPYVPAPVLGRGDDRPVSSKSDLAKNDLAKSDLAKRNAVNPTPAQAESGLDLTISSEELDVLRCLSKGTLHVNDLAHAIGAPVGQVMGAITLLEINGLVEQVGLLQYAASAEARRYL